MGKRSPTEQGATESQPSEAAGPSPAAKEPPLSPATVGSLLARSDRGVGPARHEAAMRLQRSVGNRATVRMLAREWAWRRRSRRRLRSR